MAPRDTSTTSNDINNSKNPTDSQSGSGLGAAMMTKTESSGSNSNDQAATATPLQSQSHGYHLRWSRITKTVDLTKSNKGEGGGITAAKSLSASFNKSQSLSNNQHKTILDSVSGYAAPGEVLSLMGPSGSGKTSLLNTLSGRSTYQHGVLSINGEAVNNTTMKRLMTTVGYCKQADIFFGHLTVRDQLTYTALLRLKKSTDPNNNQHAQVDRVLTRLRLRKVADSPIKMLSGGERKRVNIGTELLTDPAVLMLDEPTSGLDSTSAVALLRMLQGLARENGKTVITSIHQPSSAAFRSFDRLILLSEGRVVYFGTPVNSLLYLRQHNLSCPDGYNAADHWMDLLVRDSAIEEEVEEDKDEHNNENSTLRQRHANGDNNDNSSRPRRTSTLVPRLILEQAWDGEAVAEQMDVEVHNHHTTDASSAQQQDINDNTSNTNTDPQLESLFVGTKKYNTSWWTQYMILTHRALKNSRSAIFTPLNLCKSLAIGMVAGMLWFKTDYTERNVYDIRSYYFFTMTFWVFDAMFTALTAFPSERDVILKERASGSYHLSAYFMAKTTADAPVRLILPLIYMVVSFWMAGISDSAGVFFGTIGCTLLSVLAGESIGLFIGAAVYDLQKGLTIMTVFTLFLMLLGGFFVENIPVFIQWGKYISPFKYAFDSSLQLVFDRPVPCDGSGALEELCGGGGDVGAASVEEVLNFVGIQGSVAFNAGVLLLLSCLPRYGAYVCLRFKKGDDRS